MNIITYTIWPKVCEHPCVLFNGKLSAAFLFMRASWQQLGEVSFLFSTRQCLHAQSKSIKKWFSQFDAEELEYVLLTYLKILPRLNSILLKSGLRSGSSSQQFFISVYSCIHRKREKEGWSVKLWVQAALLYNPPAQWWVTLLPRSPSLMYCQSWGQVWRCLPHWGIALCRSSLRDWVTLR